MARTGWRLILKIQLESISRLGAVTLHRKPRVEEFTFQQMLEKAGGMYFPAISTYMTLLWMREIPALSTGRGLNRRCGDRTIAARRGSASPASTSSGRTASFPIPWIATASMSLLLEEASGTDPHAATPGPSTRSRPIKSHIRNRTLRDAQNNSLISRDD